MKFQLSDAALADVCSLVTDGTHDTPKRVANGFPLIKAKEIAGGRFNLSDCDQISEADHKKVISRSKPEQWNTLFAHIGASLGEAALVRTREEFSIKNIALFKPDPTKIDGRYFYYVVTSPQFQALAKSTKTGSAQPFLGLAQLRAHRIQYHADLPTQRKIAGILAAYDDLIENNLRRIKLLEQMAQSLYREWFVLFRFPGHKSVKFVDSALGQIPKGWEVMKLKDICILTMGQSPKSEFYNDRGEGTPFHQGVTNFGDYFPTDRLFSTEENRIAEEGDILFSVRAPVGRINVANKRIVIGRGVSSIRERSGHQDFLLFQLKHLFQEEDSMGNGAIFKAVTKSDMEDIKLLVPEKPWIERFEKAASPIFSNLKNLTQRNQTLRRTRDLLLPKLLNGNSES